jgi:hypothetical protein
MLMEMATDTVMEKEMTVAVDMATTLSNHC